MEVYPDKDKFFEDRKDFRRSVRKFAEGKDLTYAMQGGSYVFSDFHIYLDEKGVAHQSSDMGAIPEGRTIIRKEGATTPTHSRKEKARGIPTIQLHDYTLNLLKALSDTWQVQEGDTMVAFFGFHIPSLVLDTPDIKDAKDYILGINSRLKIEASSMRVRGNGDRPEYLLIG